MRILLVSNYQPPHLGGIEFAAGSLKRCWETMGHTVTWLTTDIPRGANLSTGDNIRVPALNFAERLWEINSPLVSPLAYPLIARQVDSHDVVNIHSLAPGITNLALHTAVRHKRPVVVTQHVGIIPLPSRFLSCVQEHFVTRIARWCVGKQIPLTFVGEAVRKWFIEHARIPTDFTHMTPAGIDPEVYRFVTAEERRAFRAKWKLSDNKLNVLFIGRFCDKKGLPLLREVVSRCPAIQFTFRGSGQLDPSRWNLPNVRVISFITSEELRELYGSHDLFIMPSFGEGWPAVVPQAMACGLACLISEEAFQGYNRDPGRFLVRPRNADRIVATLNEAAENKWPFIKERQELSDYALAHWNWKNTAKIYLNLFDHAMAAQSPGDHQ